MAQAWMVKGRVGAGAAGVAWAPVALSLTGRAMMRAKCVRAIVQQVGGPAGAEGGNNACCWPCSDFQLVGCCERQSTADMRATPLGDALCAIVQRAGNVALQVRISPLS